MRGLVPLLAVWLLTPATLWAMQGPAAPAKPAAAPGPPPAGSAPAAPAEPPQNYTYDPAGRRDPFLDLLTTGGEPRTVVSRRGEGAAGLSVGGIFLRGPMPSRRGVYANVQGPDWETD